MELEGTMKTFALSLAVLFAACDSLHPADKTACASEADCLNGYGCQNQVCVRNEAGDMAAQPQALSCSAMLQCAVSCVNDQQCDVGCYNRGTGHAQALDGQIATCISSVCVTPSSGSRRCTAYPGDTSADCTACIENASLGWSPQYPCSPTTDPACGRCGTQVQTCLADQ
jgi:hypothetical protein